MASKLLEQMAAEERERQRRAAAESKRMTKTAKSATPATQPTGGHALTGNGQSRQSPAEQDIDAIAADLHRRLNAGRKRPPIQEKSSSIPGLSLPTIEKPAVSVPEWAQKMTDRYKPVESAPKSPVAQWEAQKREQALQRDRPSLKDWGALAKDTAAAGVGQISKASASLFSAAEQMVTRPMGWVMGNPELYKDFPLYQLNQGADRNMEILQSNLSQSTAETGKAGELIAQFGPATIAALPQAALAYLTAGQSLLAQTSTAGLQAASTAAQLSGGAAVANTVLNAAKSMAVNPSFQYSFLNTVGGEFEQALEDGTDAPTAYAYAALTALANSVVEVGGGIDTLPDELQGKNKNQILEWVKSMFDEGKEEVIQGAISQLMQKGVYGKDNPFYSSTDENAVINPGRMATEFAGGAVVGGILGGGQMALQNAVNQAAARSFQEEVAAQIMGQDEEAPSVLEQKPVNERPVSVNSGEDTPGDVSTPTQAQTGQESAENAVQRPSLSDLERTDADSAAREPGFSAKEDSLSKGDRQMLDNLGKITGTDIRVVSQEEMARITGREDANGVQIGGQIYLSEAADRPLMEAAKHEMTHRLQETAPDAYGVFREYVAGVYRESGTLESYIEGMMRGREQAGIQLTEDQALDEIAADYAGELMVDQEAVRRLAGENRSLLERMLDGLREFIRKIKSSLGIGQSGTDAQVRELEEAARLWQNALEEAGHNVKGLELPEVETDTRGNSGEDSTSVSLSMKGDTDLKKEVERLRRQNQRLRMQMQRTDAIEVNHKSVQNQAQSLLRDYHSMFGAAKLTNQLEGLYEKIGNLSVTEAEAKAEARTIAKNILQTSTGQVGRMYLEIQKELRSQAMTLDKKYWGELRNVGGYNNFARKNAGRLELTADGPSVSSVYEQMAEEYPDVFPDDIIHPADQLIHMSDVLDDVQKIIDTPVGQELSRMAEQVAGDILERYFETPEKPLTWADREAKYTAKRLEEQKAKDRADLRQSVEREQKIREKKLKELQKRYKEANRKRIENQNATQRRETIRRHADRLGRMLLRPTDKQHIPEGLRGAALELVRQIDTGSNYFLDPDTGKRVYSRDEYQMRIEGAEGLEYIQTRRTQAAKDLQRQYKALAENGGFTIDPDMDVFLDELAGMGETPLSDMSKSQLDTIWTVMRALETCITQSNRMLSDSRYATVSEMADRLREDTDSLRRRSNWAGVIGKTDGLLNLDMLTPETYFHKLGEAGDELFRQARNAQNRQITIQGDMLEKFQEAYEKSGLKAWKLEKEKHSFDTSGGKITLTTAQVMELYALNKREQAQGHIYTGGIRPEAVRGKGMKLEGGGRSVAITPTDVAQIISTLTPEQKALADRMQDILSNDLSTYGNEASMEVYGYEKFKEENYWPIKIGNQDTKTNPANKAASKTIPGYGMTKPVKPNAGNPVVLHSAFDTFAQHVAEMSTYAGWLGTNENFTRLLNYQFRDAEGNQDGTMKDRLEHIHGMSGTGYLEKLLGDIAQGTKAKSDTVFSSGGLTSAFKSSAISANLRVALQQPTAVLRAMEMVNPKYFVTGLGQKELTKGWETAKKYAPIAKWKDWGYFEMDTGQSYKDLLLGPKNKLGKVQEWLMSPAGAADALGWGYLWKIVEAETADKHKGLQKGSEEFYQAAAERFGEIIDRTQVVDSVLHRTQMMRSGNPVHKMASSFMSEPSKQYNEIVRSFYDFARAKGRKDKNGMGKAAGHLVRTAAAMSLSFAVNAIAQSVPDMWRDDDRDKSSLEKFKGNWVENFRENYNLTGYIPYVKDVWSAVDSVILKKNALGGDVTRMDMEVVQDIVKAAGQAIQTHYGEGKKSKANAYMDAAAQLCRLAGLPLATIKKDAIGIVKWVMQVRGDNESLYQFDKLLYDEGNDTQRFAGHLYRAMGKDWEQYENIYKDISENWEQYGGGAEDWDEDKFQEKIKNAMESKMAKDLGLEKVSSLPIEYTPPGLDRSFDQEVRRQLERGGNWMDTLPEGTAELAKEIEGLKPEKGQKSVSALQKIQEIRESIWGDDAKDLFLSDILSKNDYNRLQDARKAGISIEKWCKLYEDISQEKVRRTGKPGSPSQDDVAAVLKRTSGLSEKQKDAVWAGYGWKSERSTEENVSDSDTKLEGLALPELPKFGRG